MSRKDQTSESHREKGQVLPIKQNESNSSNIHGLKQNHSRLILRLIKALVLIIGKNHWAGTVDQIQKTK